MEYQSMINKRVTVRSIIIGLLLIPLNSYWIVMMELIHNSGRSTNISIFFNAILTLLFLLILKFCLRRLSPSQALSQQELLIVYMMVNISSGIVGHDMMQILVPSLGHAFQFATVENEWKVLFWHEIPPWLIVSDKQVLKGYYQGDSSFYTQPHLLGWIGPILWWSLFISVLLFATLCLNVILRKQWAETERLSYPTIQLALEMTNPETDLFLRKLFWVGFSIAALVDLLNGLSFVLPSVPYLPLKVHRYRITNKPWSGIGTFPTSFYPFVIGMGFFIPLDLSFSCWFFFLFWKMLMVVNSALGTGGLSRFPFIKEQASGGYLALCLIAVWLSRRHLGRVWCKVTMPLPIASTYQQLDDADEPMRYRTATLGLIAGVSLIVWFCHQGDMSTSVALTFFGLYFVIVTAVTRIRAELGTPVHDLHFSGPDEILVRFIGSRRLRTGNLTMFSLFWFINRAYRSHPMPHQLEGFKMAERTRMESKKLVGAMMLAAVVGSIAGFWALLTASYRHGMREHAFGREPWERLSRWLVTSSETDYPAALFTLIGFVLTVLLSMMRLRFLWWPLHPAAFAITTTWGMHLVWSCLFISWLAKLTILRYGGIKNPHSDGNLLPRINRGRIRGGRFLDHHQRHL
jgi:hypothetical protein